MKKDGTRFWADGTIKALKDQKGNIRGFAKIVRDLSERKRLEEQLSNEKKNLEKVNKELENFTHVASHDLRAPLRAIGSFTGILKESHKDKLDPDGVDCLEQIISATDRMDQLISDLLALSKISKVQNPFELVNIGQLVEEVRNLQKSDLEKHQVKLEVQEHLPSISCDRIKMREIFSNLIGNAIKYSARRAPPEIKIGYADKGEHHEFFVRDNGIGIDPAHHQKIFGMFERLHSSREYEGTGAGLNIAKTAVESHHGSIRVESELDKGATFYFTVPKNLGKDAQGQPGTPGRKVKS